MPSGPIHPTPLDLDVDEKLGQARLMAWYDQHARILPWRVSPQARASGVLPSPYIVWISEIMLQQTTTAAAAPRLARFLARFPDVHSLAAAPQESVLNEWAGLGYYARARNMHAAARIIAQVGMPSCAASLQALPGIGAYTAAAIAAIAFGEAVAPVDANIARIMARLYAISGEAGGLRAGLQAAADRLLPPDRPGDWAQALMDLGASICRPRAPACPICPLASMCRGRVLGPENFPVPKARLVKPRREGVGFFLVNAQRVWLERRPGKGLLGGMLGLPGSPWAERQVARPHDFVPVPARWRSAGTIAHTFTHFHLTLEVQVGQSSAAPAGAGEWIAIADLAKAGLPTVFAKAVRLALSIDLAA